MIGTELFSQHASTQWLQNHVQESQFVAGGNQMAAITQLVQAGLGYGIAPSYVANYNPV